MEYTFEQLQQFLIDTTEECTLEIESDFTEEEIKDFDKVKALEYLIEFLDFERQAWQKKYALILSNDSIVVHPNFYMKIKNSE